MVTKTFRPVHINAVKNDFVGNDNKGRYVLLPGSDGRAQDLAKNFKNLTVKRHPRGHDLYLGEVTKNNKKIDVAVISTGMGCASMEIILHELLSLGAKYFLRVGTAGSLQPYVKLGDFINAQAAVRDEQTTQDYAPLSVPAIASMEYIGAINESAKKLNSTLHTGVVHCKSSLYAREFGVGPAKLHNKAYVKHLEECGVLASEMETAALFIQSQIHNQQLQNKTYSKHIYCGALLAILSNKAGSFASNKQATEITKQLIALAIETIKNFDDIHGA